MLEMVCFTLLMKKKSMLPSKIKWASLLVLCFLMHSDIYSQHYISKSQLKKALKEFVTDSLLKSASVSFTIKDLRNGEVIKSFDQDRALIPASSQKIITSAIILNELTADFKFTTPFYLKGEYGSNGIYLGDLEITGSGDPSFASEYFSEIPKLQDVADTLFSILKSRGITSIKGRINVDEKFITDVPENKEWLWYDLGNYYGAGCFGFNFAENQARITLSASKDMDGICKIFRVQPVQLMSLYTSKVVGRNQVIDSDVYVLGSSQSCKQEVLGEWKCCTEDTIMIRSALAKPSEVFSALLKDALVKKGIVVEDQEFSFNNTKELIYTYSSPSLKDLVRRALEKSVNLYCESFLHQLGFKWNGTTDRQLALLKLNELLKNALPDEKSIVIEDGSGLSPKNMISSMAFVKFLEWIDKKNSLHYFWQLLPDSFKQGSLSKYISNNKNAEIGLRLKSGSMERIKSYSGYLVYENKPVYALSLIVNHYHCDGEQVNALIADFFSNMMKLK